LQTNAVAGSKFAPVALQPLVTSAKPIAERVPDEARTTWVRPKLVAKVKMTEWTDSDQSRDASMASATARRFDRLA